MSIRVLLCSCQSLWFMAARRIRTHLLSRACPSRATGISENPATDAAMDSSCKRSGARFAYVHKPGMGFDPGLMLLARQFRGQHARTRVALPLNH
jgi:hypothetical protein